MIRTELGRSEADVKPKGVIMNTDQAWEEIGRREPYKGVMFDERFSSSAIEQNKDAFFQTGREYVDQLMADIEALGGMQKFGSALDFGCGVGRLAIPMSGRFEKVTGVDVSQAMLTEARSNSFSSGIKNIYFTNVFELIAGKFDLVNTYIVLQHIPPARGKAIVERLLGLVAPGGFISIHVPVRIERTPKQAVIYFLQHRLPALWYIISKIQRRDKIPAMQMNAYDVTWLVGMLAEHGVTRTITRIENHGGALGVRVAGKVNSRRLL